MVFPGVKVFMRSCKAPTQVELALSDRVLGLEACGA